MKPSARPLHPADMGDLSSEQFDRLAAWMYHRTGVKLAPQKLTMVQARLTRRLRATGLSNFSEYIDFAIARPDEAEKVLDTLTTHETRFFRESEHFGFLQRTLLPKWKNGVRVWSAASSTGQEAYSLAMLFLAERVPEPWSILGTDISEETVRTARGAHFPMSAAEQIPNSYLKRFCLRGTGPMQGSFRMGPEVRRHVRFQQSSLLNPDFELQFELIFLKNVLIYFDDRSRQLALSNVWSRLACGGYLLLGAAETLRGTHIDAAHIHHGVYQKQC